MTEIPVTMNHSLWSYHDKGTDAAYVRGKYELFMVKAYYDKKGPKMILSLSFWKCTCEEWILQKFDEILQKLSKTNPLLAVT